MVATARGGTCSDAPSDGISRHAPVGVEAPAVVAAAQAPNRRPSPPTAARSGAGTGRRTRPASSRRAPSGQPHEHPVVAEQPGGAGRVGDLVAARDRVPRAPQRGVGVRQHPRAASVTARAPCRARRSRRRTRGAAPPSPSVEPRRVDAVAHELLRDLRRVVVLTDEVDVLLADVGAEHRGVVGVEVHEQTGLHHPVDRVRREIGPAVDDRGRRRATREVDAVLAATLDDRVVFEDVVAVVDPLAAEQVETRRDVLGRTVLRTRDS